MPTLATSKSSRGDLVYLAGFVVCIDTYLFMKSNNVFFHKPPLGSPQIHFIIKTSAFSNCRTRTGAVPRGSFTVAVAHRCSAKADVWVPGLAPLSRIRGRARRTRDELQPGNTGPERNAPWMTTWDRRIEHLGRGGGYFDTRQVRGGECNRRSPDWVGWGGEEVPIVTIVISLDGT
jgi:hypothetical protein